MHLNSELIDLTDDFGALRFVFFQAALQVGQAREHFFGVGFIGCGSVRHRCWLFAALTGQRQSRGRGIDNKWRVTMSAGKAISCGAAVMCMSFSYKSR